MTDYTATPEQWAAAEYYADPGRNPRPMSEYACILELRARIEALEAVRPKPPSLKEQALSDFDGLMSELDGAGSYSNCAERIRRALEALPE